MTFTYELKNGWTKQLLAEAITRHVPEDQRCMRRREVCHVTGGLTMAYAQRMEVGNRWTCTYYGDGDERCAVGACLPPKEELIWDDYEAVWDNEGSDYFTPELMALLPLDHRGLDELRGVHDRCTEGNPRAMCLAWVEEHTEEGGKA